MVNETDEPVKVEWQGGLGNKQTVEVDPYSGEVTVNGRVFDVGQLTTEDVPKFMYR